MKHLHKLLFVIFLSTGLTACDDFLDIKPVSDYTDESFCRNPSDFETAIAGAYASTRSLWGRSGTYMYQIVTRGDEVRGAKFADASTDDAWKRSYASLWVIVSRCNKILDRIDNVEFPDINRRDHIKGEALAMRGYCYLQFAWCWGGVPLITKELSLTELYQTKRAGQEATYIQAASDFRTAFGLLPDKWDAANAGRVTRYAAAGMLGRLEMYRRNYQDASGWLSKVIEQEPELYRMEAGYDDCFTEAGDNGAERVWEVQYKGGGEAEHSAGLSHGYPAIFVPSDINLRYDAALMYNITFQGPAGSVRASHSLSGDTAFAVYEAGDKRKELSIVTGLRRGNATKDTLSYFVRKFLKNPPAMDTYFGNNLPVLRYTDVKMMYAEALNEISYEENISTKILPILNEVRNRAKLLPLSKSDLPDKDAVFEYIVKDRFIEFSFEGIRWPDLIRWGRAAQAMKEHFDLVDEGFNKTTGLPLYKMNTWNVLAPVPYSEIIAYGNKNIMWQNEGY